MVWKTDWTMHKALMALWVTVIMMAIGGYALQCLVCSDLKACMVVEPFPNKTCKDEEWCYGAVCYAESKPASEAVSAKLECRKNPENKKICKPLEKDCYEMYCKDQDFCLTYGTYIPSHCTAVSTPSTPKSEQTATTEGTGTTTSTAATVKTASKATVNVGEYGKVMLAIFVGLITRMAE